MADNAIPTPAQALDGSLSAAGNQGDGPALQADAHPKRTAGLKLFDVFLYPMFTNVVVFGLSVGATYLTNKGNIRNAEGELVYGKLGEIIYKRGAWLTDKFRKTGMSEEQANMSKMVFFSFADGSLIAPAVKMLEDKREPIAHAIDKKLGTEPEDLSAYEAEPKQGWRSVLGGRLATCMIVVPTAVALDKTGWNALLFNNPGRKMGEFMARNPAIARRVPASIDLPELSRVGAFEAFYTSVCTAGTYFLSRGMAGLIGKKEQQNASSATEPAGLSAALPSTPVLPSSPSDVPDTRVTPAAFSDKGQAGHFMALAERGGVMERT